MPTLTPYLKSTQRLIILLGLMVGLTNCQTDSIAPKLPAKADTTAHSSARKLSITSLKQTGFCEFTYSFMRLETLFFTYHLPADKFGRYFTYIYPPGSSRPSAIRIDIVDGGGSPFKGYINLFYSSSGQVTEATYDYLGGHTKWLFDYDSQGRMTLFYMEHGASLLFEIFTYSGANVSKIDQYSSWSAGQRERHYTITATDPVLKHPFSVTASPDRLLTRIAENIYNQSIDDLPFVALTYLSIYGTNVITKATLKNKSVINGLSREYMLDLGATYQTNSSGYVSRSDEVSTGFDKMSDVFLYQTNTLYLPEFP